MAYTQVLTVPALFITQLTKRMMAGSQRKMKIGSKASAYMSSPVLYEGHAYVLIQDGNFACYDLKTGKECWRTRSNLAAAVMVNT